MSEFITHSREETVALGAQVEQHLARRQDGLL